ncbi:hypothetical protein HPT27_04425 [Permianibacter sp. IMCC34836]|uniref:hypothetical protein n=1 Tax=Permianibacter fluminis TaxID=2738515 RepID=UPI0015573577|nr:hypothetical protein [Permianibacter fluminis]NQD36260.1 hypothetical protein [Permianibacter fluminis]
MLWRITIVMFLAPFFGSRVEAMIRVTAVRALTETEVHAAEKMIWHAYPKANIKAESMVIVRNDRGRKWVSVDYESIRLRINDRFCGAISEALFGEISENQDISWEAIKVIQTPNELFEQRNDKTCYSPASSRSVSVDENVKTETVAWVLDNESRIWNDYLVIATRSYGADFGLPTLVPKLISANLDPTGRLRLTFVGDSEVFFSAELEWVTDRWIVSDACIGMP